MKSIALAAISLLLILSTATAAPAGEANSAVSAAMTVYIYIAETEATIDVCRRIDALDLASYDEVYQKFQSEIRRTVIKIGLLVAQESRRIGIDKQALFNGVESLITDAIQTSDQIARVDLERFPLACKDLPKAIIARKKPFESLTAKFPHEMKVIQEWP
jgi:hypothetical protein